MNGKLFGNAEKREKCCIWANRFALLLHMFLSCVLNFLIETISRHSAIEAWKYMVGSPLVFLYNAFMIFTTLMIVFFFKRRVFWRFIISGIWLLLGIINGIMLSNRVTPFNSADLKVALDAVTLIRQYFDTGELILFGVGAAAILVFIVMLFRLGGKYKGKVHYVGALIGLAVDILAFVLVTNWAIDSRVLSTYFGNIAFAYEDYGFPYCFYSSIFRTGIDKPTDYSEATIDQITNNGAYEEVSSDTDVYPNIIFVQLESFFDPTEVEWLGLSEDPIPNIRNLMANYSTGYFKVPSVGAGTANTEFEVLTGMSMRYFGPGEYPYKTIMKKTTCESAAYALENFGYATHALHNNGGNFYSRSEVFANMGFDSYTSKEFMNILSYTPMGWAKDEILIRYIDQALDSSEQQDFLFTISVQGHGSYPQEKVIEDPEIQVTSVKDESMRYAWEYYVNQQHEVDEFVGDLIEDLEKRGEPTVVVFYGDHLPTMNLEASDLANRYLYSTEYVFWDNIGLSKKDQNIFAYQLTAEVMNQIGLHAGTIFNYHQNRVGTTNYLADLETLQYDLLYGEHYAQAKKTLKASDMRMGLADAAIDRITVNDDGTLDVYGTNYTPWSKLYINDRQYDVTFWNDEHLRTKDEVELEDGDEIVIRQMGSKNTIFAESEKFVYQKETSPDSSAASSQASDTEAAQKNESNE